MNKEKIAKKNESLLCAWLHPRVYQSLIFQNAADNALFTFWLAICDHVAVIADLLGISLTHPQKQLLMIDPIDLPLWFLRLRGLKYSLS